MKYLVLLALAFVSLLASSASAQKSVPYEWKNVAIVGGGFVTGIVTHPTEQNLVYARTDVGGAYRWDQATSRWIPLTDFIDDAHWSDTGIESIAIDPSDPERVYLAVGTYTTNWSPINGAIMISSDRGKTWKRIELPFKNGGNEPGRSMGERLCVDPNDGKVIWFGTRANGLWQSKDRGETWKQVESFPSIATDESASTGGRWSRPLGIVFVQIDRATKTIYAGVGTQKTSLYRSADVGATWSAIANQPAGLRPSHMAFASDGAVYISYGDDSGPNTMTDGALYKLNTKSGEWSDVTPEKPAPNRKFGYGCVAVDAQHPEIVMTATFCRWNGDDQIYRSVDGGKNWSALREHAQLDWRAAPWLSWGKKTLRMGHWIGDIEIDPRDSNRAFYTTGWGVWSTNDLTNNDSAKATHWTFTRGIEECVVNNVISPPSGAHALSVMWDIDGFRHDDLDVSPPQGFFLPQVGRDSDIDFAEQNPDVMARVYYGNNTHGAFSTDGGKTWTPFATSAKGNGGGDIAVSADGKTFVCTPENSASQVSHDRGETWRACEGIAAKLRVVSDRDDPNLFFAFDPPQGAVYASTDAGEHFERRASDLPKAAGYLRVMPGHSGNVALASDQGLFGSRDGGNGFVKAEGVDSAKRVGYGKAAPGQDYCATYIIGKIGGVYGFFRTDDLGATWLRINDDEHQFGGVTSITGDPRIYGRVYVGSSNRGVLYADPTKARDAADAR